MTDEDNKKLTKLYKQYVQEVTKNQEMRDLLTEIIQTFDSQLYSDVQNTNNPVGFLRSKVDQLLNK